MMTSNVFSRVFYMKYGLSTGTCFTLDIDQKQYIVTAEHIVKGIKDGSIIELFYKSKWHRAPVRIVGLGSEHSQSYDVAVLSINERISPSLPLEASAASLAFGQDAFFLGFPYGLYTDADVMRGFPLPLIKKAVVSGSVGQNMEIFLLDGHNNPGFSGGPVVFQPVGESKVEYRVMGVVSAYRYQENDVYYNGKPTGLKHSENAGIIIAPSSKHVKDMITNNPIGLALS